MKEIIHTGKWPEPIVLTFAQGRHSEHRNLLVGERTSCEDGQVSREMLALEKNGYIEIKQLTPPAAPPTPEVEMSPEEIAKLEEELLSNEDGHSAVSTQED